MDDIGSILEGTCILKYVIVHNTQLVIYDIESRFPLRSIHSLPLAGMRNNLHPLGIPMRGACIETHSRLRSTRPSAEPLTHLSFWGRGDGASK